MSEVSIAKLTAIHNAATEFVEGEKAVKKFPDRGKTEARTTAILEKLTPKNHSFREPSKDPKPVRETSALGNLVAALAVDVGVEEADLVAGVVEFYTAKEKTLKDPAKKVRGLLNRLHRSKGIGWRRIGTRYWSVS